MAEDSAVLVPSKLCPEAASAIVLAVRETTIARTGALDVRKLLDRAARDGYTRELMVTLRQAAENDDAGALNVLGMFHLDGLRSSDGKLLAKQDSRVALEYHRRAAAQGDPSGMTSVADSLTERHFSRSSLAQAEQLYRRAFRLGHTTAAFNLACTYRKLGRYREAVQWFRRAETAGDGSAAVEVARAELYGLGTRRNASSAFAKLRRVARRRTQYWPPDSDRTEAMLILADALITGWLVRRNFGGGVGWLRRAAKLGSTVAKATLEDLGADVA